MDTQSLCRVCLTHSKEMIDLRSRAKCAVEDDSPCVFQILERVLKRKIVLDAVHPSFICAVCNSVLQLTYKFVLDCEKSERLFEEKLERTDCSEAFESENFIQNRFSGNEPSVELISPNGRFDVRDILIVEEEDDEKPEYFEGFLNNLGREISAVFVDGCGMKGKREQPQHHDVTITKIQEKEVPEVLTEYIHEEESSENVNEKSHNHQISCKVCDKTFKKKQYLMRHVKQIHLKDQKQLCSECGYLAKSSAKLHYHMETKHSERKYQCEYCEKNFALLSHLKAHFISHSQNRAHLCNVCGKTFNYSNALMYHMRIHTGEKPFQCSFCAKRFTMSSALKRHILSHTGLRPYKCNYCEKAFRSTGERQCHEMLHTGERKYHCKYCGKGYTKTFNLKLHLLSHKGKYRCLVCDKTFIEVGYLNSHYKSVHAVGHEVSEENVDLY